MQGTVLEEMVTIYCTFSCKADGHMSQTLHSCRFLLAVTSRQPSWPLHPLVTSPSGGHPQFFRPCGQQTHPLWGPCHKRSPTHPLIRFATFCHTSQAHPLCAKMYSMDVGSLVSRLFEFETVRYQPLCIVQSHRGARCLRAAYKSLSASWMVSLERQS